ncbi:hypothetical protein QMK19_21135 [Streptomyces sp. H10-C2]|uniref:hypothetical protein n=1 Tax=unclassified Streptomyces TaxID=2593676 RepID=UPI0024BA1AF8|nr:MULTISPECIES: hypothetical protein [unclassified Streptomyces]MDJ0344416.1 hypothetical protein [Streptomyces sp. PH10-H1]MDJ0372108.1 hypothetical protein [Streptomyces sp. H10-C2]
MDIEFGGEVVGSRIPCDPAGATELPGVWVAGNVADGSAQVVAADTREAVESYREQLRILFEREAWEDRYRARPALRSGRANPQMVAEASGLAPGRALDVGSGEGADALWLAERGWQVTSTAHRR